MKQTTRNASANADAASTVQDSENNSEILQLEKECHAALLAEVKVIAEEKGVNYTNIINMTALRIMSKQMPECEEQMRHIPHVTEANFLKYGQRLLDITQRYAAHKLGKERLPFFIG